jgi:hypothetical protein
MWSDILGRTERAGLLPEQDPEVILASLAARVARIEETLDALREAVREP